MRRPVILVLTFALCATWYLVGYASGREKRERERYDTTQWLLDAQDLPSASPPSVDNDPQRNLYGGGTPYRFTTATPGIIEVAIVSKSEFDRAKTELELDSRTIAFSLSTHSPCRIVIPEGFEIVSRPETGFATFAEYETGATIAHEMLHCLRGRWHPRWSAIETGRK